VAGAASNSKQQQATASNSKQQQATASNSKQQRDAATAAAVDKLNWAHQPFFVLLLPLLALPLLLTLLKSALAVAACNSKQLQQVWQKQQEHMPASKPQQEQ